MSAALAGRVGHDLRRSATIDAPLLYVAVPLTEGRAVRGVLRLALPLSVVTSSHTDVHRVMLGGAAVALVVALGIGLVVARRVTRPVVEMEAIARRMSEGDFRARAPTRSPDEIGRLGRALNVMSASLRGKIEDLEHERARISAMLDGMVEGVIAVDARDHIVAMNEPARALFAVGTGRGEGKPLLEAIRNADLHALLGEVRGADTHAVARREFRVPGAPPRAVQANAVPVDLGGGEVGVVMVLHDVTELRRLETDKACASWATRKVRTSPSTPDSRRGSGTSFLASRPNWSVARCRSSSPTRRRRRRRPSKRPGRSPSSSPR